MKTHDENTKQRIIIDIDDTLWHLAPILWDHLSKVNQNIPPLEMWHDWDAWRGYVSEKVFYDTLNHIHLNQERYFPYKEARLFLATLMEKGFYVIVASHRERIALDVTVKWLNQHDLYFDEIHVSADKSVLLKDCYGVVDDSLYILDKAKNAGILRVGLRHPWNANRNHPLFDDLGEILAYILNSPH